MLKSRAVYWKWLPLFSHSSHRELKCVWKCCALCIYLSSSRSVMLQAKIGIEKSRSTGAAHISSSSNIRKWSRGNRSASRHWMRAARRNQHAIRWIYYILVWMRALDWKLFPSHKQNLLRRAHPWLCRTKANKNTKRRNSAQVLYLRCGWMGFLLPILSPWSAHKHKSGFKRKNLSWAIFWCDAESVAHMCSGKRKISRTAWHQTRLFACSTSYAAFALFICFQFLNGLVYKLVLKGGMQSAERSERLPNNNVTYSRRLVVAVSLHTQTQPEQFVLCTQLDVGQSR